AVPLGERDAEEIPAAVRVAVELRRRALHRLERRGEWAERALVGGELDDALESQLALDLLDRLAGLVRDEVPESGVEECVRERPARSAGLSSRVSTGHCRRTCGRAARPEVGAA